MRLLAIETSFDDCCVALNGIQWKKTIRHNGMIPVEAALFHREHLPQLVPPLSYDAIACTRGPGQALCLKEGWHFAANLAIRKNVPLIGIHHMHAHYLSPFSVTTMPFPYMCVVATGGHTQVVIVNSPISFKVIASTMDDAIGEAYDKISRLFELSTPELMQTIDHNNSTPVNKPFLIMPRSNRLSFSFSGIKTTARNKLKDWSQQRIVQSFHNGCMNHMKTIVRRALAQYEVKALCGVGGAMLNPSLQQILHHLGRIQNKEVVIPSKNWLIDNALMIELAAKLQIAHGRSFDTIGYDFYPKTKDANHNIQ